MTSPDELSLWTIYRRPRDMPGVISAHVRERRLRGRDA